MNWKKILVVVSLIVLTFTTTTTTTFLQRAEAAGIKETNINSYTVEDILALEPYFYVEDGFLKINAKEAIEDGFDYALIKGQQEYFDFLNEQVKNNIIKVSQDLSIENVEAAGADSLQGNLIMASRASCKGVTKKPQYYLWGYKTYMNSCDTKK